MKAVSILTTFRENSVVHDLHIIHSKWSQVRVFKNKICQSSTRPTGLRFQPSKGSYSYLRNVQQSHLHVTQSCVSTNPPNQQMYGNPFEKKKRRIWRSFEVLSDWTVTFGHTCLVWCYPRFFCSLRWLASKLLMLNFWSCKVLYIDWPGTTAPPIVRGKRWAILGGKPGKLSEKVPQTGGWWPLTVTFLKGDVLKNLVLAPYP